MIKKLLEAKTIEDEYNKDWNDIPRDIFDKIIALDPQTDLEKNKLGNATKQLLLPRYVEGETDFIDNKDVTSALTTFYANRGKGVYPKALNAFNNYPSVKDFVDYIINGENSEFAKSYDFSDEEQSKKQESKLDSIYKQFYEKDIDRETFNKIIELDPETTEDSIGYVAKQFLLPKFIKGENFLANSTDVLKAVAEFEKEKDTYPEDKREIQNYPSVEEFVNYVLVGPDSDLITKLKALRYADEFEFYTGTKKYDIIRPLSHRANVAIDNLGEDRTRSTQYHTWCTGWPDSDGTNQWREHTSREYIFCFINKQNPKDRKTCYQLSIVFKEDVWSYKDGTGILPKYAVYQFLDGSDNAFGDFNAGSKKCAEFFEQFLRQNPDVVVALTKIEYVKENPTVKEVYGTLKYLNQPFTYDGTKESLKEFNDLELSKLVGEIIVKEGVEVIPPAAFANSGALTSVKLPSTLKQIGYEAFLACTGLSKLELNPGLKEIQSEAFANCISLRGSLRVPDSLEKIGREAFRGAKCTLSINKARTTKLKVDPADKTWYASHTKAITVQEGLNESLYDKILNFVGKTRDEIHQTEQNEELDLNENIPPDLAKAYRNSSQYNSSAQHPFIASHNTIGTRRGTGVDYKNSNYEELTKEATMEYLGFSGRIKTDAEGNPILNQEGKYQIIASVKNRELFNPRISTLRFLTDGNQLTEFEVREGNRLVPVYTAVIKAEKFGLYPLFDGSRNTRNITRYGDFYTLIQLSDKIYKSDDYEHGITDDTPTGKKIVKFNPETGQNEIVDDTIRARRNRNNQSKVLRTQVPKDDDDFRAHRYSDMMNNPRFTHYAKDVMDTGAHNLDKRYFINSSTSYLSGYKDAVREKDLKFKEYDYARRALQKHQREKDLFDEDEWNEINQELNQLVKQKKEQYDEACLEVRQEKKNLIFNIDNVVKQLNDKWVERVGIYQQKTNKMFNNSNELGNLQLQVSIKDSSLAKDLNNKIKYQQESIKLLQQDLKDYEQQKNDLLRRLENVKQSIENGTVSLDSAQKLLTDLLGKLETINDDVMKDKFRRIDELKAEQDRLQAEIDALAPRAAADRAARAAKNRVKEIDPNLSSILDFSSETPTEDSQGE